MPITYNIILATLISNKKGKSKRPALKKKPYRISQSERHFEFTNWKCRLD